jgi:galactitol-specific phosphotransferase system IIB component|tara:strand:- start:213 stop:497 length:285 start_codon:yes stop_codon:yes gene_type:complete
MGVPFKSPHFIKKELPVTPTTPTTLNTSKTFSMNIENIATEKNITHMEAVLDYCQRNELEPDTVGNLISKSLKEKIEANARDLNFLPKQAQLPV